MTQKLDELMNIPFLEDALKEKGLLPDGHDSENSPNKSEKIETVEEDYNFDSNDDSMDAMLNSDTTLAMIEGADHAEAMDRIYKETLQHADDFIRLAYNSSERSQARILEQASNMYARAIEAKNAKRDSQLKALRLALEKRKLDIEEKRLGLKQDVDGSDASKVTLDRNNIIKAMIDARKNKD